MSFLRPENTALIGYVRRLRDFETLQRELWYRVPVKSAPKNLEAGIVQFMGFLFRKQVGYWGKVVEVSKASRCVLLPHEGGEKADDLYYRIRIESLEELPRPITGNAPRRLIFIETTPKKLLTATDFNDAFNDSPLEDEFWAILQEQRPDEDWQRQYHVKPPEGESLWLIIMDFALPSIKLNIEVDGATYHDKAHDERRDAILAGMGWRVLRFSAGDLLARNEVARRVSETVKPPPRS